ncbi:N-acetylmuramoyl-L-alanine amidase [Streptomyces sp. N2-109]|uniref:N-acetylmuramoyl-L-alanine amidase n=1 Tax=Streptomyces gossypii TaxID=2883101 RepID=A0ABT2JQU4_9ACTN|nr:N-acetylmuramoyl-L-alanine amidase [Streptomyces gossypii]MCT2590191.1 N-acetylmuramoyl-L-alanine amidase [Streptomyces gossypii]
MSYGSPSRRAGTLMIALATLVPLCFAGWLVWKSVRGPEKEADPAPALMPVPSAAGSNDPDRPEDSGKPDENGKDGEQKENGKKDERGGNRESGEGNEENEENGKRDPGMPLSGRTVVLDPGHNPNNRHHPGEINAQVNIGTNMKACDTTGTQTNAGYTEASFTLDLAHRVRQALEKQGANVKLTQDADRPFGPCIDERAEIGNEADADAVVSLHADGSGQGNRGFHVILPASVRDGKADTANIVGPSRMLGAELAASYRAATGAEPANYLSAENGLMTRSDLGGLNLSKVPKVFLECGNMRDPQDAAQLTDPKWRGRAADGVTRGLVAFLTGRR